MNNVNFLFDLTVVAQGAQGPGTVIAHPGQDVELLCTGCIHTWSISNRTIMGKINHNHYGGSTLSNGMLPVYSANLICLLVIY